MVEIPLSRTERYFPEVFLKMEGLGIFRRSNYALE
jgi:hypothetical protein